MRAPAVLFLKRNLCYICAVLSWVLLLGFLFALEFRLYDHNLDTGFWFLLIFPPSALFGVFCFGSKEPVSPR